MGEQFLKELRKNKNLVSEYEVYGNYDKEVITSFHIVSKKSHLGIKSEDDARIKSDFKM